MEFVCDSHKAKAIFISLTSNKECRFVCQQCIVEGSGVITGGFRLFGLNDMLRKEFPSELVQKHLTAVTAKISSDAIETLETLQKSVVAFFEDIKSRIKSQRFFLRERLQRRLDDLTKDFEERIEGRPQPVHSELLAYCAKSADLCDEVQANTQEACASKVTALRRLLESMNSSFNTLMTSLRESFQARDVEIESFKAACMAVTLNREPYALQNNFKMIESSKLIRTGQDLLFLQQCLKGYNMNLSYLKCIAIQGFFVEQASKTFSPVIVLARVGNRVFGGFCDVRLRQVFLESAQNFSEEDIDNDYEYSENTFLFSLTDYKQYKVRNPRRAAALYAANFHRQLWFGEGDLMLSMPTKFNVIREGHSSLGRSYYLHNSLWPQAEQLLAGKPKFVPDEIEIFLVNSF